MRNVQIESPGKTLNFQSASELAKDVARENEVREPTIVSWHRRSDESMSPFYEGANPDSWWEKYGKGNGGELEVSVGDEFQFVMTDSQGYETLGEFPLRNLSDEEGNPYLCFTPILGRVTNKPNQDACTYLDGWAADQL